MTYFKSVYSHVAYDYWRRTLPKFAISNKDVAVLECGIGPGALLSLMVQWFPQASIFGLDIDLEALSRVKQSSPQTILIGASAEALPFPDQNFNFIIALHMIEHLDRPEEFFREAYRVLRSGGILVLATPNPEGFGARLMRGCWSGWIPEHISLKSPDEWRGLVRENGFSIVRDGTTGLSGIPLVRRSPLAILNWGLIFIFGLFPWGHGEAYVCILRKE